MTNETNWDKPLSNDIVKNVIELCESMSNQPIVCTNIFHSKKEFARLILIGYYKISDIEWSSEEYKNEIEKLVKEYKGNKNDY